MDKNDPWRSPHASSEEDPWGDSVLWRRIPELEVRLQALQAEVEGALGDLAADLPAAASSRLRAALQASNSADACSECHGVGGRHQEMCPSW